MTQLALPLTSDRDELLQRVDLLIEEANRLLAGGLERGKWTDAEMMRNARIHIEIYDLYHQLDELIERGA